MLNPIRYMDVSVFKNFINELADISGAYISKNFCGDIKVDYKADSSPVTLIDKNTELMLREAIKKRFPTHGIIGEEYGNENTDAEYVWVIDPIDGTKSFISGVPLFGTIIGLMRNKEPIVGVIDQPILKQRCVGDCHTCTFNGNPVKISDLTDITKATVLTSDHRHAEEDYNAANFRNLINKAAIFRSWGDCFGYMLIARGYAHLMLDARLEVWDLVPLIPVMKGAGICFSDWDGADNLGKRGCVAACTKELHDFAIRALNAGCAEHGA